jgi:protein-S-isoprenylcysteine O-methyltransferase Ste14
MIGRTILLYRIGIKVWVIGKNSKNIIEILLVPFLIIWSIFVVITAFHMNLPQIITIFLINIFWIKYTGITFCYIGLIIFLLALISFGKSWRVGIDK